MAFGSSVDIKKLPNREDILSCITDEDIFVHYLGGIPKRPICSPIRKDNIPSFSVFFSDNYRKLMYKDFATGDRGDVFVFVMNLFGLSKITDAFCLIANDFQLTQFQTSPAQNTARKSYVKGSNVGKVTKDRISMSIKLRKWSSLDKDYWSGKYGFTLKELEYSGVFPISHYFMNEYCRVADEVAYAFLEEKDGIQTYKIYQPFSKENKWVNNNDYSTWEMWSQLPEEGKNLIIASSRKDAMSVLFAFKNPRLVASCALQSENTNAKFNVINELKSRFENIYVLYDNDFSNKKNPGRRAGKKLCDKFGLIQLEIPEEYGSKDPSDFIEAYDKKTFKELIKKLIRNEKNNINKPSEEECPF